MSANPISRARLFGSVALVITTLAALTAAFLSIGPSGLVWAGIIGASGFGRCAGFSSYFWHSASQDGWTRRWHFTGWVPCWGRYHLRIMLSR